MERYFGVGSGLSILSDVMTICRVLRTSAVAYPRDSLNWLVCFLISVRQQNWHLETTRHWHNYNQVSKCSRWCRSRTRHLFRFLPQANQIVVHPRVSWFLITGFLGFGLIRWESLLLRAFSESILSSNYLWWNFFGVRGERYTFGILQTGSLSQKWLHYIFIDRTTILSAEQAEDRPNTPCLGVFFHVFCLCHARRGWVKSSLYGLLWSLSMGCTNVKNIVCLGSNFVLPVSILNLKWM